MLRKLEPRDAVRMHEWMHDEDVIKGLQAHLFRTKTLDDCLRFVHLSQQDDTNFHRAIVDEQGTYQGTISLKNINHEFQDAEFAIVLHSDAQGKGYAKQSMKEIMEIAFGELNLNEVYWNVLESNTRAISLYEKSGAVKEEKPSERLKASAPNGKKVIFYKVVKK